uniref:Uncharacterized protein n=1 Tax=Rousettus aegyptiacus TaxID=9407 RepID=A0A7J8IMA8_ROUAE|nr:hypothetical protein HJG63_010522 [Rousettus aegyptiacus]
MGTKKAKSRVWPSSVVPCCVTLGKGFTLSVLRLFGSPSLSPLASRLSGPPSLRLPLQAPEYRPPPLPGRQWVEEAGRAGKGGRGRSYRNRLGLGDCSTGEPGRASLHRPHFHQPALPPSSALQTFLANLGCCSPGRGNCRRHSTRPPETLNPFPAPRQSLQAGGWAGRRCQGSRTLSAPAR